MSRGGSRPGSGRKPKLKLSRIPGPRRQVMISMPRWIHELLKADEKNLSAYIVDLIMAAKGYEPPAKKGGIKW